MTDHPSETLTDSDSCWVNSPAWTLLAQAHDGRRLLVLTGGADETYIVDEAVTDACVQRVVQAWQDGRLATLLADPECGAAVRQMQRVGALVPSRALDRVDRLDAVWLGEPCAALVPALTAMMAEYRHASQSENHSGLLSASASDEMDEYRHASQGENHPGPLGASASDGSADVTDLLLVIRTTAGWESALSDYAALRLHRPHLFIDMAYHHTVGVGPFVVPGETACVACLGHRVAHRWGDLSGPAQPLVSGRPQSVAALLAAMVAAPGGLLPLIETSVSLNLQTLASVSDKVFQLPWCPACGVGHDASSGALNLPWQAASTPAILPDPAGH